MNDRTQESWKLKVPDKTHITAIKKRKYLVCSKVERWSKI